MATKLQGYQPQARPTGLPNPGASSGAAAEAAGAAFGRLGARIGQLADEAAQRAGALEGQAAGAAAGEARQALNLRRDGTLRGEAADAAAIEAYGWRLETRLREGVATAWTENRDDPEALDRAFSGLRGEFEQEIGADPAIRESFGERFSALSQPYRERAAERLLQQREAERAAAAAEAVEAMMADVERRSYDAAGRPNETAAVGEEIRRVVARIDQAAASRAITPEAARQAKQGLLARAETANLRGGFDSLEGDPEAQERYAAGLVDLWTRGEIGGDALDLSAVRQLAGGMASQAQDEISRREAAQARTERRAEQAIDEWNKARAAGLQVSPDRQAELMGEIAPAGEAYTRRAQRIAESGDLLHRFGRRPASERAVVIARMMRAGAAAPEDAEIFARLAQMDEAALKADEGEAKQRRGELLSVAYGAALDGAPFDWNQAERLFSGTAEEPDFQRIRAMAGAFSGQRAQSGSFDGQRASAEAAAALPYTDRLSMQFGRDYRSAAEKNLSDLGTELRGKVATQIEALKNGVRRGDFDAVMSEVAIQDPELARELSGYQTLWAQTRYNRTATAAELFPRTEAGGAFPPMSDAATLGMLRANADHEARLEAERKDFMATDAAQLIVSPLDLNDPHTIATRALDAATLARRRGLDAFENPYLPIYFTQVERAEWNEAFKTADRDTRLRMVANIIASTGSAANRVIADLALEDRQLAHAAHLAASTGSQAAARNILRGQEIRADKNFDAPSQDDVLAAMGPYFSAFRSAGEAGLTNVREAAVSIAAARSRDTGESFTDVWPDSVQAAAGGMMDHKGNRLGGLQMVNRAMTLLPAGVAAAEVQSALLNATPESLAAASLFGRPLPIVAGGVPSGDKLQIFASGDWTYVVGERQRDGTVEHIADPGSPLGVYEIDLRKLLGRAP